VRRIFYVLLNAATVLSLTLCVAAVALWVQSYWRTDRWMTEWPGRRYVALVANRGTFYLNLTAFDAVDNGQ
jgi:hypothetical protein